MKVREILQTKGAAVVTIEPDRTVHEAMKILCQHRIGALIVRESGGELAGIISERDILREGADRCEALKDTPVREVMTEDLIIGVPDDRLDYVMGIMTKNRIRHLPILDNGELAGIISIGDVVNAHLGETAFENRLLRDYIHGVTH